MFGEDSVGPLSEELAIEAVGVASDEQVADDAPGSPGVGEQGGNHGDTTEESSEAGDGGDNVATSPVRSTATGSDTSDYEDSGAERDAPPPPAPATRGKSPSCGAVNRPMVACVKSLISLVILIQILRALPPCQPPPSIRRTK